MSTHDAKTGRFPPAEQDKATTVEVTDRSPMEKRVQVFENVLKTCGKEISKGAEHSGPILQVHQNAVALAHEILSMARRFEQDANDGKFEGSDHVAGG